MKRCFFLIFFLASCSINETKNTPLFIAADSSSFVILDKNKFYEEGFEITIGKKDFIIVGLPYVDNEEILNYGEYVIKILPKFFV